MGGTNAMLARPSTSGDWRPFSHHRGRNFLRTAISESQSAKERKSVGAIISCYPRSFTSVTWPAVGKSQYQHTVPIAIKAIARADGVVIRVQDQVATGKRTYQHQQRRSGQMKIGQERINSAKFVARDYRKIGKPGMVHDSAIRSDGGFEW